MIPIGIDLGTTNSLIAVFRSGAPELIPNGLGEKLTPSAVYLAESGELEIGAAAKAKARVDPARAALSFKLDMGRSYSRALGPRMFTPVHLSSLVLLNLKRDAERYLGQDVTQAVITVPAYFDDARRAATKDAAKIAGLQVLRIVNEPTAAAIAYGLHAGPERQRVLVMDLGGGTFDVSVLDIESGVVEILATAGDTRLGGDDVTSTLVAHLRQKAKQAEIQDLTTQALHTEAAERAKHALSTREEIEISWPRCETRLSLRRVELEAILAPLLSRIEAVTRMALARSGRKPRDFDTVLLVGGATRMPCVQDLARRIFDRAPTAELHPDEAIALGASIQAALVLDHAGVEDLVVTDIAPFSLGVAASSFFGARMVKGMFSPILERGTVLPASRSERYFTAADDQRKMLIEVFQGEHARCEDNEPLGTYSIEDLPRAPAGQVAVDVRLSYDLSGLVDVDMKVVGSDLVHSLTIDKSGGALSDAQIEMARKTLQGLKVMPSETLPNRYARNRADAAFQERTGDPRRQLGELIAAFDAALETQDPKLIEDVRSALLAFVDALET